MKVLLTFALLPLALLAGCAFTAAPAAREIDTQYEYGYFAGLPQRPSLMK